MLGGARHHRRRQHAERSHIVEEQPLVARGHDRRIDPLLARRVGGRVRNSIVGPLDRVLGAGFGALKGLIGATILFMVLNLAFSFSFLGGGGRPDWMTNAASYGLLKSTSGTMSDLVVAQQNAMDAAEQANAQNAANAQ
jgi:uncharacterized membrane protein required for colicin V production